jgi:DeoR family fructose operon transcriptional repressor
VYAEERQDRIERLIASTGRVAVLTLANDFDVTTETIRRDLAQLADRGALRRVHGGAVASTIAARFEETIADRRDINAAAKARIATAAMTLIPSSFSGSIAIDGGTTTEALADRVARWIPDTPLQSLLVITNSLGVATTVSLNPQVEVQLLGGRVRRVTSAAVGSATLAQIQRMRVDIAFIGANGVHPEFGLSTPDEEEAAVKSALTRGARQAVSLADATKLGREALVRFADLDEVATLITDEQPASVLAAALREAAVEVIVA